MTAPPIIFDWSGEVMTPATPFMARLCDEHYVIGMKYRLIEEAERSVKSHNHYFASVENAWRNLPESMAEDYPTSEHLRKKALIRTGFADERSIVCASKAEALRVAGFMKPMDHYAIVTVSEATIKVYTAQSQSRRAMGSKVFQESKEAVLRWLDTLLDVRPGSTAANARTGA